MFSKLLSLIKGVIRKLIPYKDIEQVEHIESPLSPEMINAMDDWYLLYLNKAPWLSDESVKSRNLPAFISSELARSITLELDWNITGKDADGNTQDAEGAELSNPRSEFLKKEFKRCIAKLREKLEQGLASGGMTVRPYPKDGHIYFDWTMAWGLYPVLLFLAPFARVQILSQYSRKKFAKNTFRSGKRHLSIEVLFSLPIFHDIKGSCLYIDPALQGDKCDGNTTAEWQRKYKLNLCC